MRKRMLLFVVATLKAEELEMMTGFFANELLCFCPTHLPESALCFILFSIMFQTSRNLRAARPV